MAYAATKSGIVGMTFVAARDLGSIGVRAMAIAPRLFQTGLTQGIPDEMVAGLTVTRSEFTDPDGTQSAITDTWTWKLTLEPDAGQ